jgi:heme exporter protein C
MLRRLHQLASPKYFYEFSGRALPFLLGATALTLMAGLYFALFVAPPDYQQGESYRILFVHVPAAWMSLFTYVLMAAFGIAGLVFRARLAHVLAAASAPLGASFTVLALVTGSLWGKPMWGTWWVWDARLTSELLLLFLYLGYMGLASAFDDARAGARAAAVLAIVGLVNIPIIHFSVEWWSTLHQGPTIARLGGPAIHSSMLLPLLLMAIGFQLFYFCSLIARARLLLLHEERQSVWVQRLAGEAS